MKKSPLFVVSMALLLLLLAGQWLLPRREFSEMENRVLAVGSIGISSFKILEIMVHLKQPDGVA